MAQTRKGETHGQGPGTGREGVCRGSCGLWAGGLRAWASSSSGSGGILGSRVLSRRFTNDRMKCLNFKFIHVIDVFGRFVFRQISGFFSSQKLRVWTKKLVLSLSDLF